MISWLYLLVAGCGLLLFFLYKEWKRTNRARLMARMFANVLAMAALLWLAKPLTNKDSQAGAGNIVLLSEGYNKDSVQHFLAHHRTTTPVSIAGTVANDLFNGRPVTPVADWRLYQRQHPMDTIHVFGDGFNKELLDEMEPLRFRFHPNAAQPVITHISWNAALKNGEPLQVQGHFDNVANATTRILLLAFGVVKDSITVQPQAEADFVLQTVPLQEAHAVYSLVCITAKDTISKEPVPVSVRPASPMQLLILSSSPDFDNSFLKNQLSSRQYAFTISTLMSTGKTQQQYINTKTTAASFTSSYFSQFDAVLADEETLGKMNTSQVSALRAAVRDNGTGLLIKVDSQRKAPTFYSTLFPVQTTLSRSTLQYAQSGEAFFMQLNHTPAIEDVQGNQPLLKDTLNHIYSSVSMYGEGRLLALSIENSYSLALAGDKSGYQKFWTLLLEAVAKRSNTSADWQVYPSIIRSNETARLNVMTVDTSVHRMLAGDAVVHLTPDPDLGFVRNGMYWPASAGWQALQLGSRSVTDWYVYGANDWRQTSAYEHRRETNAYVKRHASERAKDPDPSDLTFHSDYRLLFFIILLAACIFLWVEQKRG